MISNPLFWVFFCLYQYKELYGLVVVELNQMMYQHSCLKKNEEKKMKIFNYAKKLFAFTNIVQH